jgi:hypothetical protein
MDMRKIHLHSSGEAVNFDNAFLVESDNGVVAVDATPDRERNSSPKVPSRSQGSPIPRISR